MPYGGPADGPTSHQGELIYAGHCQVNHDQDERNPPVEEHALPVAGRRALGMLTKFARVLLLCACWLYASYRTTRFPKETGYTISPGVRCPSLAGATAHARHSPDSAELAILTAMLLKGRTEDLTVESLVWPRLLIAQYCCSRLGPLWLGL